MKTTKANYELFKSECKKWITVFGMLGWEVYYQHKDLSGNQFAYCLWPQTPQDRVFTIGLSKNLPEYDDLEMEIKRSAFHEVMEAFLYRISYLGEARYLQPEEIPEERHHIIRTLEKVIFKKGKK